MLRGFRETVLDCNLYDLDLVGYEFTWNRGRGANNLVEGRLDRAMGTPGWHERFPSAQLKNLVAPFSDHNPILLETSTTYTIPRVRKFRFENKWLDEPDIGSVVGCSWVSFKDFEVLQRLKATSLVLEDWGQHIARANARNRQDLEREIERLRR